MFAARTELDHSTVPDLFATLVGAQRVISVIGAGGKKTTMYALARAAGGRVALSSTAHMYPYDRAQVDAVETVAADSVVLPHRADARVVAYGGETAAAQRIGGLTSAQVAILAADATFDLVLLKADGARARWIKAPAAYEPIIAPCTDRVLYLVSAQVIGRPLDQRIAHRPELIAAITGAVTGQPLTAEHVGRLLASSDGALKDLGAMEIVPVINMVDDPTQERQAARAATVALALTTRFDRVVLASMRTARVVAVVARGHDGDHCTG